jgi:hypothetical protein
VGRTQKGLKDLSMHEISIANPKIVREGTLASKSVRAHQQCEVTMLREDKNKNGKRISEIVKEAQIIGRKARKINKKKDKLEKLQEATENRKRTS